MTRSQSLRAQLAADPAITALIGSGDAMRMYPVIAEAPKGQTVLIYKIDVRPGEYTLNGPIVVEMRLDLQSFATDYDAAHALADAIQANLMPPGQPQGFSGLLGGVGGVTAIECYLETEPDDFVAETFDVGMFKVPSQYVVTYLFQ